MVEDRQVIMNLGVKQKSPAEKRKYAFDFVNQDEIVNGETLTGTPTVTGAPAGLTITDIAIAGTKVQFFVAAGSSGQDYQIDCTVTTSDGATLVECGTLRVLNC